MVLLLLAGCTQDDGDDGRPDLSEHEIVFTGAADEGEAADLWLLRADGTDPVRLTDASGPEYGAAWSPDGDRVVYVAGETRDGPSDLFVVDLEGGEPEQVTSTPDRCESEPTWTPDGAELVYVSGPCGGEPDGLFAIGVEGGTERSLVAGGGWPDVGPDGRLLYTAPVPGKPWYVQRLWVSELDGSNPRDVTPDGFETASEATWSPEGDRIAFVSAAGDMASDDPVDWNEDVYVMDADGSDPQRLTTTPGNDHWPPSWSPDGRHLVYSADGVENFGALATVDLETLEITVLTDDEEDHDLLPAWRP